MDRHKEVVSIQIGQNESSKYWLGMLNELRNRGINDILLLCVNGLSGIKEFINVDFQNTEYQRCIVHQVRNTLEYVSEKDKKAFATDLKKIHHAVSEKQGFAVMQEIGEKWYEQYPYSMKS